MLKRNLIALKDFDNHKKGEKFQEDLDTAIKLLQDQKVDIDEYPEEKNPNIQPITAKQLLKIKPPKDWIIQGLQRPGEIEMDYSDAGGYKSLLALYRAVCIAYGKPFFKLKTKKSPVIICDNENSIPLIGTRLKRILKGMNKKASPNIDFFIKTGQLDYGDFADELKKFIIKKKAGLVIIDTARRFHSKEENSSTEMNEIYKIFSELIKNTTTTLLILHHTTKQGDYRGSGDLKGMLDIQMEVKKMGNEGRFQLSNTKNRWGEIETINGRIEFEDDETGLGKIIFEQSQETIQEETDKYKKFKKARGFILNFVRKTCPVDGTEFRRIDLIEETKHFNVDNQNEQITTRLLDSALKYLVKRNYLLKGEKLGTYLKNFSDKPKIAVWESEFASQDAKN